MQASIVALDGALVAKFCVFFIIMYECVVCKKHYINNILQKSDEISKVGG